MALGNEAKMGDLVKPKKLNCIYFKTNNKQIMNNEEKGQICSKGHQRKERNSDWINKLGLKGKDRKDLTISKQKKNKGISRSTVAARWRWCRTAGAMRGTSVSYHCCLKRDRLVVCLGCLLGMSGQGARCCNRKR